MPKLAAPLKHFQRSDLRAVAQLATQATLGVTDLVEGVHQSVWSALGVAGGPAPGQTGGVTGAVYKSVRAVTQWLGSGVDSLLVRWQPVLEADAGGPAATPQREALLAALNGVIGDRLAASGNPLAIAMSLHYQGRELDWQAPLPAATGKVLLLIHGLCMNDRQWGAPQARNAARQVDHAQTLAAALGYTPVYLRYNSGLHISHNGRQLAELLQQLADNWPVALEEISVLAHSMGGLLMRSALHYASEQQLAWPAQLKNIVFLGVPHHGAPLERAGNRVDALLCSTPFTAPFARLGQLRSAGITDLRYGHLLDDDWRGRDRFARRADSRRGLPLPEGVACFAVAASAASRSSPLAERLIGDGLVPVPSALGQHRDARRQLAFAKTAQLIVYGTRHNGLLGSPAVSRQLLRWLQPKPAKENA